MNDPRYFGAPWSASVKWVSGLCTVLLPLITIFPMADPRTPSWMAALTGLAVFGTLAGSALFMIRGYELTGGDLNVVRPFWRTRIELRGLKSVELVPEATRRSLRLCGNGGLYSFTGWYRNSQLGTYRLYAMRLRPAVVLRFALFTVVVTPDRPEEFVKRARETAGLA